MSIFSNGLKTFPLGGVHPKENKFSADKPIEVLPLPEQVAIPISQHIGAPAKPVVEQRQTVKAGQVIAKSEGFVSANIHASVSGIVTKIDKVMDSTGYKRDAVIIKVKGDEWDESIDRSPDLVNTITLGREEIIKKIADAGIVGMGGATFPSHVKLSVPRGKKADYLVLNGVECEPYLTADHRLMLEKSKEILVGCKILMIALGVDKAIIGIEENKPDAIALMREVTSAESEIQRATPEGDVPTGWRKTAHQGGTPP